MFDGERAETPSLGSAQLGIHEALQAHGQRLATCRPRQREYQVVRAVLLVSQRGPRRQGGTV